MDFRQNIITTLHDMQIDHERLKSLLEDLVVERPASLVIPVLYGELRRLTLPNIIKELNKSTYLSEVIIALSAENEHDYQSAVNFFQELDMPHLVVWCNGPRINAVIDELRERELDITAIKGKGRDMWIALGIASLNSYAIIMHDADIKTYTESIPARLLYPIVDSKLDFFFSKGYYARIGESSMYGRVFRLFVHPLLDALIEKEDSSILRYLKAFRYPLSGEVAMTSDMAMNIRISGDWGLELSMLTEVFRNARFKRICQVDLGFYEHKHQEVGVENSEGLLKMAGDIMKTILSNLSETEGMEVSAPFLISLSVLYRRMAQDLIRQYNADAIINGLEYNRHDEEILVDAFNDIIKNAAEEYSYEPSETQMPEWLRAISAMPKLRRKMRDAVQEDMDTANVG